MRRNSTRLPLILLLVVILTTGIASAAKNELPILDDGRVGIQEVVTVEGASASELQDRARLWVAENYNSAPDVMKLDDTGNGIIVVKGLISVPHYLDEQLVDHTVKIEFKDGRARYTISDLVWRAGSGPFPFEEKSVQRMKKFTAKVLAECNALAASLTDALETPVESNDDW